MTLNFVMRMAAVAIEQQYFLDCKFDETYQVKCQMDNFPTEVPSTFKKKTNLVYLIAKPQSTVCVVVVIAVKKATKWGIVSDGTVRGGKDGYPSVQ